MKKIVRSKERFLFGVCAGIANFFKIDPTIVRLVFGILAVTGFATLPTIIVYVLGILVIPEEI